jgi:hypothetical protein
MVRALRSTSKRAARLIARNRHARHKKRTFSTYNSRIKANSANKIYIRDHLIRNISVDAGTTALILDDANGFTCRALIKSGAQQANIYAPNIDPSALAPLRKVSNPAVLGVPTFVGDVARTTDRTFTIVFHDGMGTPGTVGKANTPVADIQTYFQRGLFREGAVLGITVCARSHTKNVMDKQNLHDIMQQVYHHAETSGHQVSLLETKAYTDPGSQTMYFVSFKVYRKKSTYQHVQHVPESHGVVRPTPNTPVATGPASDAVSRTWDALRELRSLEHLGRSLCGNGIPAKEDSIGTKWGAYMAASVHNGLAVAVLGHGIWADPRSVRSLADSVVHSDTPGRDKKVKTMGEKMRVAQSAFLQYKEHPVMFLADMPVYSLAKTKAKRRNYLTDLLGGKEVAGIQISPGQVEHFRAQGEKVKQAILASTWAFLFSPR